MPPRTRRYEPPHYPLSATLAPGARTSRTWPAGTRAPRGGAAVGGVALRVGGPGALPPHCAPPGGWAGRDDRLLTRAIGGIPASGWPTRASAATGPGGEANRGDGNAGGRRDTGGPRES